MGNLRVSFAITNYATAAVLILGFGYLLYKNHTGSNLRYVKLIAWFSICSSVGIIINSYFYTRHKKRGGIWARFIYCLGFTVSYLGFNMAHWIFCFMYFKIQSNMWFLTNNQTVPLTVQMRDQQIDFFFKAVNTLVPILAGCAYILTVCFSSSSATKDGLLQIYAVLKFTVGVLNMISAGFLCYGVLRIRYISKKRRGDDRLKINQMLLHLGAFALLLISLFISNYFYAYYI
jgi:hypothetical protein